MYFFFAVFMIPVRIILVLFSLPLLLSFLDISAGISFRALLGTFQTLLFVFRLPFVLLVHSLRSLRYAFGISLTIQLI